MDSIFQKIPFSRITLAFALGIVAAKYFQIPIEALIPCLVVFLILLVILNTKFAYKRESAFGGATFLFFLVLGATIYSCYNRTPVFVERPFYMGTILEKPQGKPNSYKSIIQINSFNAENRIGNEKEKALVYFAKSEAVQNLKAGNRIIINSQPDEIKNFGSPFSFDYKSYLNNKRIYRQFYLSEDNWKLTNSIACSPTIQAELWREKLLNIYRSQNLGANETEILSALTLGYKRDLDPETKRIFSAAGAMHVLAVSGLHVGIIYLIFGFLFGFMQKQKTGRIIFVISSIILLWLFAFITGLSPSVLRASTMFTIVIIGENTNRKANIYNSLTASAMFLLLLNPNNLYEVGFQLSYSAVFGIVFLQPRIFKLVRVKNKIIRFSWKLLTVSIAAQFSTFPLTAYYFNQFPTYFALTNLIVIPAITLLIPLGLGLLLVSEIPFLSAGITFLLKWIIKMVYTALAGIETFPSSVIDISLYPFELICVIAFLFFAFRFINHNHASLLKWALCSLLVLSLTILAQNYYQQYKSEVLVFNNTSNITVLLVHGKKSYVISQNTVNTESYLYRDLQGIKRKRRLLEPIFITLYDEFEDEALFLKNGLVSFDGKFFYFDMMHAWKPSNFTPDYAFTNKDFRTSNSLDKKTQYISTNYIKANQAGMLLHSLKTQGVFYENW